MGDCAGRGADLFESIAGEILAAMNLGWRKNHAENWGRGTYVRTGKKAPLKELFRHQLNLGIFLRWNQWTIMAIIDTSPKKISPSGMAYLL